jgi:hypothetical protein
LSITRLSLARLASNFSNQNSGRVPGTRKYLHPSWACQKHPWTNTTA